MKYEIHTKEAGTIYASSIEFNDEWMGASSVTATIKSPTPIKWSVGDYIVYRGDKYSLAVPPSESKCARRESVGDAFIYENVKFVGYEDELVNCEFRDVVLADDSKHFTALIDWNDYFEDVTQFADRLKANLDRLYNTDCIWTVRVKLNEEGEHYYYAGVSYKPETSLVDGKKSINISFSGESVWDSLKHIKDEFDLNFFISGRTITIGTVGSELSRFLSYGKGNGLTKIERNTDESQAIITRLRAYGNTTNMPLRFYQKVGMVAYGEFKWKKDYCNYITGDTLEEKRRNFNYHLREADIVGDAISTDYWESNDDVKTRNYYIYFPTLTQSGFRGYDRTNSTYTTIVCEGKQLDNVLVWYCGNGILLFFDTTKAGQLEMTDLVKSGKTTYFTEAVDKNYWPVEWLTASTTSVPDNLNIQHLMMRGFGEEGDITLDKIISTIYNNSGAKYDKALQTLAELGYDTEEKLRADFDFSDNPLDPWVQSKNANEFGIKEGSVTFDGSVGDYDNIYPSLQFVGDNNVIVWAERINDNGVFETKTDNLTFKIHVELNFNPRDYISYGKTSFNVHMQDGFCGGRDFECIGVTHMSGRLYEFTLNRSQDSSLDLYFPYKAKGDSYQILAGDKFVMTDIDMPDEYVKLSSANALLPAAIKYLKANCNPAFTYTLSIDPVQMQRFCDEQEENKEATIHDTIKAGDVVYFGDTDLNIGASKITIDKLTIKEGDGLPKYEISLSEDKIVGSIQRLQNKISSLTSIIEGGNAVDSNVVRKLVSEIGDNRYMRSDTDTSTEGNVTIKRGLSVHNDANVNGNFEATNILSRGNVESAGRNTGINGWGIDNDGKAEFDSVSIRKFLEVPELKYNRVSIKTGVQWQTFGGGVIESVIQNEGESNGKITLKLEAGEIGMVEVGDLCMGIFHNLDPNENQEENDDEHNGNFAFAGFMTVYFRVVDILNDDHSEFIYELRDDVGHWSGCHPVEGMNFAAYANDELGKEDRKNCIYSTTEYSIMLKNMISWNYDGNNIVYIEGRLDNFSIPASRIKEDGSGYETYDKQLEGHGIAFGNAYMFGNIEQFQRAMTVASKESYYIGTSVNPEVMKSEWAISKSEIIAVMSKDPVDSTKNDYVYQSWKTTYSNGYVEWSEPQCVYQTSIGEGGLSLVVTPMNVVIPIENGSVPSYAVSTEITGVIYKGSKKYTTNVYSGSTSAGGQFRATFNSSRSKALIVPTEGATWVKDRMANFVFAATIDGVETKLTAYVSVVGVSAGSSVQGPQGVGIESIVEEYQATTIQDQSLLVESGWSTEHIDPTPIYKYVWNREVITYTDSSFDKTNPHLCCTFTDGIVEHYTWYYTSSTLDEPDEDDFRIYEDDIQSAIADMNRFGDKYLWQWEVTRYKDSSKDTSVISIICIRGEKGLNGCVIRMMGEYSDSVTYVNESNSTKTGIRYIDVVQVKNITNGSVAYYQRSTLTTGYMAGIRPTSSSAYWTQANMMGFIATDLLISKNILSERMQGSSLWVTDSGGDVVAGVQSVDDDSSPMIFAGQNKNNASSSDFRVYKDGTVVAEKFKTADEGCRVEVVDGMLNVFGSDGVANIRFGVDSDGNAIMSYYNKLGQLLYDLGPNGITKATNVKMAYYSDYYTLLCLGLWEETPDGAVSYSDSLFENKFMFHDAEKVEDNRTYYKGSFTGNTWSLNHSSNEGRICNVGGLVDPINENYILDGWYFVQYSEISVSGGKILVKVVRVKNGKIETIDSRSSFDLYMIRDTRLQCSIVFKDGRPFTNGTLEYYMAESQQVQDERDFD